MSNHAETRTGSGRSVAVVGCGNIGSYLVPLLARTPDITKLVLVDHDGYEEKNLTSQNIEPRDVGRPKAEAQARRVRRLRPDLDVTAVCERVENAPMGLLRCDLIAACLDSRMARQATAQISWRLGVPLVDAGVAPADSLARVSTYLPSPDAPCLECSWSKDDYDSLEYVYGCSRDDGVRPTNGTSRLGSLAASLQAHECQRVLSGDSSTGGSQLLMDASTGRTYRTGFRRNDRCRFDHCTWRIEQLAGGPNNLGIRSLPALVNGDATDPGEVSLRVEGRDFVTRMVCPGCGHRRKVLRLEHRLLAVHGRCRECGGGMDPIGFDMLDRLALAALPSWMLKRPIGNLGIRPHDVFTLCGHDTERHYEIGSD